MKRVVLWLWLMLAVGAGLAPFQPVGATVSSTAPRNDYVGTGATATYSYTFKIFDATDLRVTTRNTSSIESTLTYPTDYTVTGVGKASGGTITLTAGNLTSGYALTIRFDRTPRQSTDLRNQGSFFPETHEAKFDELTRYVQQLDDVIDRSIHLPETEAGTAAATTLPVAADRASKFLAWDSSGKPIAAAGTSANLGPVSSYINGLLDDTTAAAARTTLGLHEGMSTGTIYDAKGDLIVGASDNSPARLAPPTTAGYVPRYDPSATNFISWGAQPRPVNLLRNTQWQIRTALGVITKFNKEGTGTLPNISVSSYTTGTNQPVFTTANTSQLKVGDVVKFSGADANVTLAGIEVTGVTTNTSFTGFLAQGKQSTLSGACTAQIVTRGDITGSTGAGPDPWQKTVALNLWIDDNAVNKKDGSNVQVGIQQTAGSPQRFYYQFLPKNAAANTSFDDVSVLAGRTIVFGTWVNYKVRSGSGTYKVYIETDSGYTYGTAQATLGYAWSEVSVAVPTTATFVRVGVEFNGSVNDAYYVSQPMLAYGTILGSDNYSPPVAGAMFTPTVKFSPDHWVNATLTFPVAATDGVYPWTFYMKAETLEAVSNDIIAAWTELEGVNSTAAGRAVALMSSTVAPQLDGPIIYSQVIGVKMAAYAWWWIRGNGTGRAYALNSADSWSTVSIDFSAYILR